MADRLYTVLGQNPRRIYDAANNPLDVIEVTYAGPNNISGRVNVPAMGYSAQAVDAMIRADLGPKIEVSQLGT